MIHSSHFSRPERRFCTSPALCPETRERWWDEFAISEETVRRIQLPRKTRFGGEFVTDVWEWFHRHRFIIAAIAVILPSVVLTNNKAIIARWRQRHPVPEAHRIISSGTVTLRDVTLLKRACNEQPDRPDLLRALAKACIDSEPAQARRCYDRIVKLGATTDDDAANHALLLARMQAFTDASAVLGKLRPDAENNPAVHRARLLVRCASGDFPNAAQSLDSLLAITPDDAATCLDAAESAARKSAPDAIVSRFEKRAIDALLARSEKAGMPELEPLISKLLDLPLRDQESRRRASSLLSTLPEPRPEYSLASAVLRHSGGTQPELREAFQSEVHRLGGLSANAKMLTSAFLQRQHQHALVLELIAPAESYLEPALFECRLESLLALGQWREASVMSRDERAPKLSRSDRLLASLDRLDRAPDPIVANTLLGEALAEAREEKHPVACYTIGCVALEMKLGNLASDAFACAIALSPQRDQTIEDIVNTSRRGGMPVAGVLNAIFQSGAASAASDSVQRQLCYLRFLSGQQIPAANAFVEKQKTNSPNDPYFRLLQAFSEYRSGRFNEVLHLLIPLPRYRWQQGEAAVIASLICSAGSFDHCAGLISQIDTTRIFPEERALLEPWRTRLSLEKNPALAPEKLQASNQ